MSTENGRRPRALPFHAERRLPPFAWAAENHVPLRCRYKGMPRAFCPITLGRDEKGEVAHVWMTGGAASGPLPAWRTFRLEHVTGARLGDGEWQSGPSKGGKAPSFAVDYDANRESPYAPAHSLGELRGEPQSGTWPTQTFRAADTAVKRVDTAGRR